MKKRILSILLTLCMVLCLMPTAAFAEGNEDTPMQALTNVAITFPAPKAGENITEAMKAASANADSGLNLYLFGPALWKQDGNHQKLKADDTYQKDSIYLLNFTFYTQKPITDETVLTCNGNPITRYPDYPALAEALNAYDGQEDAYLGLVMFSEKGILSGSTPLSVRRRRRPLRIRSRSSSTSPPAAPITLTSPPKTFSAR